MRGASIAAAVIIPWAGLLLLLQWWTHIFAADTFFKLMVTLGILLAVIVVVALIALIVREYFDERKLRDKDLID